MTSKIEIVEEALRSEPKNWLVTGAAGFIGSNLVEDLLKLGQTVVGLDNFSTGYPKNIEQVRSRVGDDLWGRFKFIEGDVRSLEDCRKAVSGIDHVSHQAALGSVPRSIKDPVTTNEVNVDGFLNMLVAARDMGVKSFTYAASSSTYGDHPDLPKVEEVIGKPLSPYAVTKYVNELYADVFSRCYGFDAIGLRYFNVFGPRQDPDGAYAAVIPRWIAAMLSNETIEVFGDGETSRDFCYVKNAVQANILAACAESESRNKVYNIAKGERTSLNKLFNVLKELLGAQGVNYEREPAYQEFRSGDVRHSLADVSKAAEFLGYQPQYDVITGLEESICWYRENVWS